MDTSSSSSSSSMSTAPGAAAAGGGAAAAGGAGDKLFKNCWSCRVLSGGGLIAAGAYVMRASTSQMRVGVPPTIGVVFQLTVAASLAAWGIVVIGDPVGRSKHPRDQ